MTRPLQAVKHAANQASYTASAIRDLVGELQDGITIRVIRDKSSPHTILDFVTGKCDELPIALRIELQER